MIFLCVCASTLGFTRTATGAVWSSAYQPTRRSAKKYEAIFVQGRAEYRRRDADIDAHTEIAVSPEDDVEVRRVTLTNLAPQTRTIELTSYAEVVLAPLNAWPSTNTVGEPCTLRSLSRSCSSASRGRR